MGLEILSPEEEQKFQSLLDQLRPMLAQQVLQDVDFFIDNSSSGNIANLVPIIYHIVNNYLNTIINIFATYIRGCKGINSYRYASGAYSIEVALASTLKSGDGEGSGLAFTEDNCSGQLQVAPEDFLYTG